MAFIIVWGPIIVALLTAALILGSINRLYKRTIFAKLVFFSHPVIISTTGVSNARIALPTMDSRHENMLIIPVHSPSQIGIGFSANYQFTVVKRLTTLDIISA